jgi:hypothetical protein
MSVLRYLAEKGKESCVVDTGAARDIPSSQLPGSDAFGIYQPHPNGERDTVRAPTETKASSRLFNCTRCVNGTGDNNVLGTSLYGSSS